MKKVLIFSLSYFPKHVGGAEVSIKEITDRITDIEFHLVANRYDTTLPQRERIGNVTVHRIGFSRPHPSMRDLRRFPLFLNKPLYQFLAVWHALRLHRIHRFDAVWAVMAHSAGVPASIFSLVHPDVPYVLNLQEGDPIHQVERTMRPLWPIFALAFTRATVVQCLSSYLAVWAKRRHAKGKVVIIPNGADVKHFSRSYTKEARAVVCQRLGKKPGDVFLVSSSRLVHKNALDEVIRALAYLPAHVHFVNVGVGPDGNALQNLAQSLGLAHRVHLLDFPGFESLPDYLRACDIFIRPSRSEGFGISFIEAMAAGIPVVATQEGGIADFLFDEKRDPAMQTTGWAVDVDSPEQIAAAVRDILAHPEKTREVVATAHAMVSAKYDWHIIARTMRAEVFAHLFGEGGSRV